MSASTATRSVSSQQPSSQRHRTSGSKRFSRAALLSASLLASLTMGCAPSPTSTPTSLLNPSPGHQNDVSSSSAATVLAPTTAWSSSNPSVVPADALLDGPALVARSHVLAALPLTPAKADWNTLQADNRVSTQPQLFSSKTTGREGWFGRAWAFDYNANECNTRNDILKRDLVEITFEPSVAHEKCTISSGVLIDPYSGERVEYTKGPVSSQAVQIDHVVPLAFAFAHGAWNWPADKRLAFANDPLNLVTTAGHVNGEKSDSGLLDAPQSDPRTHHYSVDDGPGWPGKNQAVNHFPIATSLKPGYYARFLLIAEKYQLPLGPDYDKAITKMVKSLPGKIPDPKKVPGYYDVTPAQQSLKYQALK